MKLIIAGASGVVASEVVRQSLRLKDIKTVIALARKPIVAEGVSAVEAAKLRSVIIDDYETYPEHVRREFADADACIWTVAITPSRSQLVAFDEVKRVCQTCTLAGFRTMVDSGPARPFRFLYMSGSGTERDQTKRPRVFPDYVLMRGETENQVLAFAASQPAGSVEACVVKPSMITSHHTYFLSAFGTALRWTNVVPNIRVEELVAAMLEQVRFGFEKEPLFHDDLKRIGREVLAKQSQGSG